MCRLNQEVMLPDRAIMPSNFRFLPVEIPIFAHSNSLTTFNFDSLSVDGQNLRTNFGHKFESFLSHISFGRFDTFWSLISALNFNLSCFVAKFHYSPPSLSFLCSQFPSIFSTTSPFVFTVFTSICL